MSSKNDKGILFQWQYSVCHIQETQLSYPRGVLFPNGRMKTEVNFKDGIYLVGKGVSTPLEKKLGNSTFSEWIRSHIIFSLIRMIVLLPIIFLMYGPEKKLIIFPLARKSQKDIS